MRRIAFDRQRAFFTVLTRRAIPTLHRDVKLRAVRKAERKGEATLSGSEDAGPVPAPRTEAAEEARRAGVGQSGECDARENVQTANTAWSVLRMIGHGLGKAHQGRSRLWGVLGGWWMLAALVAAVASGGAAAHEELSGDITIEHPWAMPGKAGGTTRVFMLVRNDERSPVHLLRVTTPVAEAARIGFRSIGRDEHLESVPIPPDEKLRMDTSHMWVELLNLREDLEDGETFPATIQFSDGRRVDVTIAVGQDTLRAGS
jgi:hypothetical protein